MEHSFKFFMNASLIILANIHKTVFIFFPLVFLFKTPFLSTTKSCMCVKIDTKQKPPPCFTELRLHDGISVNTQYPVRVALRCSYQPQPQPFCSISSFWSNLHRELWWAGFVPLVSWLSVSCQCSLSNGAAWSYNISPLEGILFFACVKRPLLLMKRVRGQHLLNHS